MNQFNLFNPFSKTCVSIVILFLFITIGLLLISGMVLQTILVLIFYAILFFMFFYRILFGRIVFTETQIIIKQNTHPKTLYNNQIKSINIEMMKNKNPAWFECIIESTGIPPSRFSGDNKSLWSYISQLKAHGEIKTKGSFTIS